MSRLPADMIKQLGGWRSACYEKYFRFSGADKISISTHLLSAPQTDFSLSSMGRNAPPHTVSRWR
jgi:hypothetical protein